MGTKFGSLCGFNTLFVGALPLQMTLCNSTTVVAVFPPGAGSLGNLSLTVGVLPAVLGGGASMAFGYAPPAVTAIVGDDPLALPTLGTWPDQRPSNVTLVGSNFGPAGSALRVTFTSAVDGVVREAVNCSRDPVRHTWVTCLAVSGVGVRHHWTVVVGGQAGVPSAQ